MIHIEVPDKPFSRGETLKGTVSISAESFETVKEIKVLLLQTEVNPHDSKAAPPGPFTKTLFSAENVEIGPVKIKTLFSAENVEIGPVKTLIPFTYTIPEDAPYTFDSGVLRMKWQIMAAADSHILQVALRMLALPPYEPAPIIPYMVFRDLVVLPHVFQQSPAEVPLPVCKKYPQVLPTKPFHLWGYSAFTWSNQVKIRLHKKEYNPGDRVSGAAYFSKTIANADITCYLVFLSKHKEGDTAEEEQVIGHRRDTFFKGSTFQFSCSIPDTAYPTFETEYAKIWWAIRAVIKKPFRFTKVAEKEIKVNPL